MKQTVHIQNTSFNSPEATVNPNRDNDHPNAEDTLLNDTGGTRGDKSGTGETLISSKNDKQVVMSQTVQQKNEGQLQQRISNNISLGIAATK